MYHCRLLLILLSCFLTMPCAVTAFAQTHLILGGEDGDFDSMILRPRQIEEGPDGNLYILDGGDSCIKVYSPAGEYLRKLAGEGQGPGEIQRADGSSFGFTADGNIFFTEFFGGHRWLTIMDLNGGLIRTLSPQLKVNFGILAAESLADGSFLVQFSFNEGCTPTKNYYLYNTRKTLVKMDNKGEIVAEIMQAEHPTLISYSPNGATSSLPFRPSFTWFVRQDKTILWGDGMSSELDLLDFSGSPVQKLETTLPTPEKVTEDILRNWCKARKEEMVSMDSAWWQQYGRVVEEYKKSLFDKPVLRRISSAPQRHFLVEGTWSFEGNSLTYWLFDEQGNEISTITTHITGLHISGRYLLFFSADDDGNILGNAVEWSGHVGEALSVLKAIKTTTDE